MKAVFLDRDGVLIEDTGFIHKIEDFRIKEGVIAGLLKLQKHFLLFIVTNQSGIGRGIFSQQQYDTFHAHLLSELRKSGIEIKKTYVCPHVPEQDCDCRKPKPFFLELAKKEFDVDLKNSFMLGDRKSDVLTGHNAGTFTIFVESEDPGSWERPPHFHAKNFSSAVAWILREQCRYVV